MGTDGVACRLLDCGRHNCPYQPVRPISGTKLPSMCLTRLLHSAGRAGLPSLATATVVILMLHNAWRLGPSLFVVEELLSARWIR